jgi:uncharacterized protein
MTSPIAELSASGFEKACAATLEALEDMLDVLLERHPDAPTWEFCEGLMSALLCTRRPIDEDEWLPVLFECDADDIFASDAERANFLRLWNERLGQLCAMLVTPIDGPDDELVFYPAVIDWRGLLASQSKDAYATAMQDMDIRPPALAQLWAAGFMVAVDHWMNDWALPSDEQFDDLIDDAIGSIAALLEEDTDTPEYNMNDPAGPPSISALRVDTFAAALNGVYLLFHIASGLVGGLLPVRNPAKVGRNDPCPCGSGKKYKKCCGRG